MTADTPVDNLPSDLPDDSDGGILPDDERLVLSADDIEAAYTRALEAVDAVEQAVPELFDPEDAEASDDTAAEATAAAEPEADSPVAGHQATSPPTPSAASQPAAGAGSFDVEHVLQPQQVIEAALFVGGEPLTTKRLAKVLGSDSNGEAVEQFIGSLNARYRDDARPYEIRLGEGGYQLTLVPEFERVRDRVYGRSPKDVKLSQDALEVLAFVAYQQPVHVRQIEDAGKSNAAPLLRQLLRRQLVRLCRSEVRRSESGSEDVTYETTPRFLELFGLRSLDDLPLPEDLAMK